MYKDKSRDPVRPVELGAFLKQARTNKLYSLRLLHEYTRIKYEYLEAIERGDFDSLPGGLFNRTFVEIYARELSIPLEWLSPFYDAFAAAIEQPAAAAEKASVEANSIKIETSGNEAVKGKRPPKVGEYLLYLFLSKSERVHMIGDLAEEYKDVYERFGRRSALTWYYKQVYDSLRPLVRRTITRLSALLWLWKYAGWMYEQLQHLISLFKRH
jgi:hypothetical protein